MEAAEAPIDVDPSEHEFGIDRGERSAPSPARSAVGARLESIPTSALTEGEAVVLARQLQVFSSPKRLRLLWELLDGERSVGELARSVGMSPSLTSFQLRWMREAGLTVTRKQGTRVYYRLHDTNLRDLLVAIRSHHAAFRFSELAEAALMGDQPAPVITVADTRVRGEE